MSGDKARTTATTSPTITPGDAVSFYTAAPNAWLYDRCWGSRLCQMYLPPLERLLLARLRPGATVLDVCCGSGWVSQAVAARGFAVTGLDLALPMLARARVNAPDCRLLRADAGDFTLRPVFAGAFSTGNSLNVIVDLAVVARALRNVHDVLVPGGILCFDVLLSDFQLPPRTVDVMVEDDLVAIWREDFDAAAGLVSGDQMLFYRDGRSWQRCDSRYSSQLYTEAEIRAALAAAGFAAVRLLAAERDLGYNLRARTFVVAQRPHGSSAA